jgi:hypothetical protein
MRWIASAVILIAMLATVRQGHRAMAKMRAEVGPGGSSVEPLFDDGPGVSQAPEDKFAWEEFAALVHPDETKPGNPPVWSTWFDKCNAGLIAACPAPAKAGTGKPAAEKPSKEEPAEHKSSSLESAVEIPKQLLSDFDKIGQAEQQDQFVQHFSHAAQLNAVLFNPVAADSIRRSALGRASSLDLAIEQLDAQNLSGADRRLPAGTFLFGSEIVKLIWEIIPDNSDKARLSDKALPIYDPSNPPVLEAHLQLAPQDSWTPRLYRINWEPNGTCPDELPAFSQNKPVSVNCFYSFQIHTKRGSCAELGIDLQRTWCEASDMGEKTFRIFLMGFHVMKLTPGNPDWIWSTYYWTRDTNEKESGKLWKAPWNHFHQMTTTAIRENAGDHAICYNPYLEGIEANGLKDNCLSCHSFAAYAPNVAKAPAGTANGAKYPYPKETRLQDELDYFRGAVQTSFVWSISTSQSKPEQDPAFFQNKLEKVLKQEFQNK